MEDKPSAIKSWLGAGILICALCLAGAIVHLFLNSHHMGWDAVVLLIPAWGLLILCSLVYSHNQAAWRLAEKQRLGKE